MLVHAFAAPGTRGREMVYPPMPGDPQTLTVFFSYRGDAMLLL